MASGKLSFRGVGFVSFLLLSSCEAHQESVMELVPPLVAALRFPVVLMVTCGGSSSGNRAD